MHRSMSKMEGQQISVSGSLNSEFWHQTHSRRKATKREKRIWKTKGPSLAAGAKSLVNLKSCQIPSPNNWHIDLSWVQITYESWSKTSRQTEKQFVKRNLNQFSVWILWSIEICFMLFTIAHSSPRSCALVLSDLWSERSPSTCIQWIRTHLPDKKQMWR